MSGAPVPGVVNVHQGITPGGSPQVLSIKALRNTEKKLYHVVPISAENRCISSFNAVKPDEISLIWYQKLPESVVKKCINTKSSCNSSKHMKNAKMLGHCSTPPCGRGSSRMVIQLGQWPVDYF